MATERMETIESGATIVSGQSRGYSRVVVTAVSQDFKRRYDFFEDYRHPHWS